MKLKAVRLRRKGYLYSEIAKSLGIAKSTAYVWTSTISLTDAQAKVIASRNHFVKLEKVKHLAGINKKLRRERDEAIGLEAKSVVSQLFVSNEYEKILCAVLFWCEGGKDVSGGLQFINSDPTMVQTFLALFRKSFALDESKFRALIHLHDYHDPQKQLQYWSKVTTIPASQFHKSYLKPHTGKNTREGYPGCVSIRYLDRSVGKLLQMIYTEFGQQYRGVR